MTSELQDPTPSPARPVAAGGMRTLPVQTRLDHVRLHSTRCYWDLVECRWRCSRD